MTKIFNLKKEEDFNQVVDYLLPKLHKNATISLVGELGAGKTTFVKYLATKLGIKQHITSPTFNIIKQYDDKLCHIDAYRVLQEDLGLDYYLDNGYIMCIEWAVNISDYIDEFDFIININYTLDGREVIITE